MSHREDGFFLTEKASKARLREAENARKNRAEIVKAFSQGKVTRRDLVKMGLITTGGLLAPIHGLNPFVNSAYASSGSTNVGTGIPTGAPPSPTFGVQPFSTPMPRFDVIPRGTNPLGGDLTRIAALETPGVARRGFVSRTRRTTSKVEHERTTECRDSRRSDMRSNHFG